MESSAVAASTPTTHPNLRKQSHDAQWSEAELIERMLLRDNRAWAEFLRRYRALILVSIRKITRRFGGLLSSTESEEIFAEFLFALQERDMHRLRAFEIARGLRLSTWVTMLARNAAWDRLRRVARQANKVATLELLGPSATSPDPELILVTKGRARRVHLLFETLTQRDRDFIELQLELLPPAEIASEMGISVKTVYSKKHKLQVRLRSACEAAD